MALIPALVVFAPGTKIKSAEANSNFDAIKTAFNTSAVLTDVARTINVAHTFNNDILFTDASFDIGKTGATRPRDGFFSRNLTVGAVLTAGASPGAITSGLDRAIVQGTDAVANDLTLAGPATSQIRIFFSKPASAGRGEISYNMATDGMRFVVAGAIVTTYGASGVWNFPSSISANLTGTILTASQPNITSVGTLTGLIVSPSMTIGTLVGNDRTLNFSDAANTFAWKFFTAAGGQRMSMLDGGLGERFTIFGSGQVTVGTQVIVSAASGDLVLKNTGALRSVTIAANDTIRLIEANTSNQVVIASGGQTTLVGGLLSVVSGQKLNLDTVGDTYLIESAANRISLVTGGTTSALFSDTFLSLNQDLIVIPTGKLRLDGTVAGDTYIYESSGNVLDLIAGTFLGLRVAAGAGTVAIGSGFSLQLQPTQKLYLDGGGDTYLQESAANNMVIVAGGVAGMILTSSTLNLSNLTSIAGATTYSGNVSGNLTGTILTAAQGNITSLGTLTSLTVSGALSAGATTVTSLIGLVATTLGAPSANTATLATIGGAGSPVTTQAQAKWLPITGSDALVYYVPAWR
jgi:hypothetical protein